MKYILIVLFAILCFSSCKKEEINNNSIDIPNPMTDKKGWELVKHSPEFEILTAKNQFDVVKITLELVKEHADGIDILYTSTRKEETSNRKKNIRWRAYHNNDYEVNEVVFPEVLISSYSAGLGSGDLYAIAQIDKRANKITDPPYYQYDYLKLRTFQENIHSVWFQFKNTQSTIAIGSANPQNPFVCNGLNARIFKNSKSIYNWGGGMFIQAAAPKANQLVMLALGDSSLYVLESNKNTYMHSSGSYGEEVNPVIIKNVYSFNKVISDKDQNFVEIIRHFYTDQHLYVFLGLRNQEHRLLKIDLNNYTLKSENESLYEKMDLTFGFKNVILLEDRPGEVLSMESDGIYHLAGNKKTFIPSPQIKVGSSGSTVFYSNGKVWQVLFDANGSYLISKTL